MSEEEFWEEDVSDEKEGEDDLVEVEEEDVFETVKNEEEFIYDEVKGGHGKKHILSDLNKKKLNKHEMDDLFCAWD